MRQETNNEIDLLLRRLGRQDTAAPDDHLDPDELNSYAENVLPPAARARYTEHLAECARCRDLVVQLSSSAGVVVAPETAKVSEPSTLRKFLASLFSPMVLRYAGPALGLVVVATIGFIVLREGTVNYAPVAERRAQQQPGQATAPASEPQPSSSLEKDSRGFVDTTKSVNKPAVKDDAGAETGAAAPPPPPNAPPVVSITTEVQDAAKKVEREQEEAKEAPAPKGTPAIAELKTLEPVQKQAADNRVVVANEPAADKAKAQDTNAAAESAAASPRRARGRDEGRGLTALGGATTQGAKRDDAAEKDKDEAVIRTVAGRRFRKQGNVWIDTDHSSSRVVTSVTRDSEQYRALVADEPAIKQIADALDGEIIVVWKGRAYRIH